MRASLRRMIGLTVGWLSVLSVLALPAPAAEPKLIGAYRDWNAFILEEASGPVCWMVSRPKRQEGEFTRRGDVFLLVVHRPAERSFDVVNFIAGYPFAERSEVLIQVGRHGFKLFSDGEQAWARDDKTDRAIAQAMTQGSLLKVQGTSLRGNRTIDTFSLAGSGAAYQAIGSACADRAPPPAP
ncbi:invasion associated locus B family protein [Niveispirillum fermenti]|uniref:invasion associated locus B family protein n=1 Tax=Niveispirillum fermenti TaxID=1233113 RepID=UPI003A844664